MQVVENISLSELRDMADARYSDFVKGVVDVARGIIVLDAELHVDEEQYLLEHGSLQDDLWGFNLYPDDFGTDDFIEFDSLINIRPRQGNRSRSIEDEAVQERIRAIVDGVVHG